MVMRYCGLSSTCNNSPIISLAPMLTATSATERDLEYTENDADETSWWCSIQGYPVVVGRPPLE
jgi:hypothetical protein